MAFDGLFTRAMTTELQQIVTGRIAKIHQPNAQEVVMHIRANGKNVKLLFSIHPSYARVHLTEHTIENPSEPPMFCTLLRKHIEGGIIHAITQVDCDRILLFEIHSTNEIGDATVRQLYVEIMGRHSNLLLVDPTTNIIIDALKHLSPLMNRHRTIMPGQPYIAPPQQNKVNPFLGAGDFFNTVRTAQEITQHFAGFSQLHAQEVIVRNEFEQYVSHFAMGGEQPTYVEIGQKIYFSPNKLTQFENPIAYPNNSALLDRVFYARAERDRVKQQAGDLERWLQNEISKLHLKSKKLTKDYERATRLDEHQLYGELLMANIYAFQKGATEVTVTNYYTNEEVTIPVSARKTPIENAQQYYTKYNKAKNALIMIQAQLNKTQDDIQYFEMLMQQVEQASPTDIEEIREELAEQGYLKRRILKKKKKNVLATPEKFISSTGIPISVGKNNKQNDALTFKIAKKSETWLHTKDIPGSHVVIHSDAPDETTLQEAAMLAGYFSKARASSAIPVDYTLIKQVKKPSGAKPGFVIYFEQKTLYVTPDETKVIALKQ